MSTIWEPHAQTPRLFLRPLSIEDVDAVHEIRRHPEVRKYLMHAPSVTHAETHSWLSTRSWPTRFNFAILLIDATVPRSNWPLIGLVGCPRGQPESGYAISHAYAGQGFATEAMAAFLKLYWQFMPSPSAEGESAWDTVSTPKPLLAPLDHVQALADADNIASHRVLEKCGFRCLGRSGKEAKRCPGDGEEDVAYKLDRPTLGG